MHKMTLLIIVIVVSPFITCSQGVGVKAGLSVTMNSIDMDDTRALGAYLGLAVADSLSNNVGIQIEAVFNRNALDSRNDIDPYNVIEGTFLLRYLGGSVNFIAGPQIVLPANKGLMLSDMIDHRQCDLVVGLQIHLGRADGYLNISYNHGITDYYRDLPIDVASYAREFKLGIDGFF